MKGLFHRLAEKAWFEGDPAKDQSVGLAVFGTLEIALGILCFSLAMLLMVVVSGAGLGGMKPIHFWLAMGFFFFLAGWSFAIGLGCIKARRWARALSLAGAKMSLFFGAPFLAIALYMLPEAYNLLTECGLFEPLLAMGLLDFAVAVLALVQLVFPVAAIAFFELEGVRGTCERRHPEPCWTDRYPLPLLSMGLVSLLGSLSVFAGATTNHVVFLFGRVASGTPGLLVNLLVSAACAYAGWGAFHRKMSAWWVAYALVLSTSTSMMLTFSGIDSAMLYAHMGYSPEQIAKLELNLPLNPVLLTAAGCAWGVMASAFLVWVRDRFLPEPAAVEFKSYARRKAEEEAAQPAAPVRPRMRLD